MGDVLIVDDDPDIRGMLAFMLGDHGFAVREAADGLQALAQLEADPPAAMVLDLMMPRLDGFGVLERMREGGIAPDTQVLILTCFGDEASLTRGWELGADAFLTKPTDPDLLAMKLAAMVGTPSRSAR